MTDTAKKPEDQVTGKKPGVDLAKFDAMNKKQDEGIDVEILSPDRTKLGFTIRVAGPDSQAQKKAVETLTNETLKSEDISELTAEDVALRRLRGLAMSVLGWSEFVLDGEVYKFSHDNALALFQRFPFIRDQVEDKAGRRSAFL